MHPKTAEEAEALGVLFFFTNEPCRNGHVALRRWCRFTANGKSYIGGKCETCRKLHRQKTRAGDEATKLRSRVNSVIRSRLSGSKHRSTKVADLLGCSIEKYMYYIEQLWEPGMSWGNWGTWHIDHRRPCKTFDLTDPVQIKKCFCYTNTRPLWAAQNRNPGKNA